MDYRNIQFGMSDAQSEGQSYPHLLTDGYLDCMGITHKAIKTKTFLFLGYKGSGKSALSAHLRLSNLENIIINDIMMKSFPYKLFSKIVKGEAEHEARFPIAWRWILLLYVLYSFDSDTNLNRANPDEWVKTIEVLRKSQLFPIISIADIVTKCSKRTFKVDFKFFQYSNEHLYQDIDTDILVNHLKKIIKEVTTTNKHYLIIDGLDDFLSDREQQNQSIISLINEAKDLNDWFANNSINFKILILCRKDVFDRLSDPNKNKIRQDYSYFINWFDESEADDYKKSNLIKLANLRGRLNVPELDDLFDSFFPNAYENQPICNALLEYTRHTPRDFLQLLKYIQNSCCQSIVTERDIYKGIKNYSLDYFQGEIRDEMAGYIKPQDIEKIFQLLSQLRKREFKLYEIQHLTSQDSSYTGLDLNKIFSVLFECSAIGHIKGGNKHYIKYRNPNMSFSYNDAIIIHKGLWKALIS